MCRSRALHHHVVMQLPPEPVDTPSGKSFVVRCYRSGTMDRFPSASNAPGGAQGGGLLLLPLTLLGWMLHITAFRGSWTVAVVPWHSLPGHRYRERAKSEAEAAARAAALSSCIQAGQWMPGTGSPPVV
jgi:hypothetical protein